jgi:hypothetical protein
MSLKKYVVRLTEAEREFCKKVIGTLLGSGQKVRRAQILLKTDADGPAWTDAQIADAFSCRTKTVENVRQRFVELGFEQTLNGKSHPPLGQRDFSMESKKRKSLRCDSALRQQGTVSGRYDCWLARSSSCS